MARVKTRGRTFRFDGRPSPARGWDIRFRVAATALVSAGLLGAPPPALVPLGGLVLGLLGLSRATLGDLVRVVRSFSGFLVFFVGLGLLFEPTWAQAAFLGTQALRLTLLLLLGQFLYLTATPTDVTEGIRWYLGWLGPRRAWAGASMAGWALGSVPSVLDQVSGLMDAARLRGLDPKKHPLRVLELLTLGLLVKTVGRAADRAAALEVRGFGTEIPPPVLRARHRDAAALGAVVMGVATAWGLGLILGT